VGPEEPEDPEIPRVPWVACADQAALQRKLEARKNWSWQACANPALLRSSTHRLVETFQAAYRCLESYYRGVDNPVALVRLIWQLQGTLRRSLALRYRCKPSLLPRIWPALRKGRDPMGPRRPGRMPRLPSLLPRKSLEGGRPVALYGRRWCDSRLGLNLNPLLQLARLLPPPRRRRVSLQPEPRAGPGPLPRLAQLRRPPSGRALRRR
jgi:hypothetical protein